MIYLLVTCVAISFAYLYRRYMNLVATVKHIPGPPIIPFFGNALIMAGKDGTDFVPFGLHYQQQYGMFARFMAFWKVHILLGDPEDIRAVLVDHTMSKADFYEALKPWLGDGLLSSMGRKWHSRRKVITQAFHFGILQGFVKIFDANSEIFVEKLSAFEAALPESFDAFPFIQLCALDNICGKLHFILSY